MPKSPNPKPDPVEAASGESIKDFVSRHKKLIESDATKLTAQDAKIAELRKLLAKAKIIIGLAVCSDVRCDHEICDKTNDIWLPIQAALKVSNDDEQKGFEEYLKTTSEEVRNWPEWKKGHLGRKSPFDKPANDERGEGS